MLLGEEPVSSAGGEGLGGHRSNHEGVGQWRAQQADRRGCPPPQPYGRLLPPSCVNGWGGNTFAAEQPCLGHTPGSHLAPSMPTTKAEKQPTPELKTRETESAAQKYTVGQHMSWNEKWVLQAGLLLLLLSHVHCVRLCVTP